MGRSVRFEQSLDMCGARIEGTVAIENENQGFANDTDLPSHLLPDYDSNPNVQSAKSFWASSNAISLTHPSLYRDDGLQYLNGTHWTENHQSAFHFITLSAVPAEHIVPAEFIPSDDDPAFQFLEPWWSLNRDDLVCNFSTGPCPLKNAKPRQFMLLYPVISCLSDLVSGGHLSDTSSETSCLSDQSFPETDTQHFASKLIGNMLMAMRMAGPMEPSYELVHGRLANSHFFHMDYQCSTDGHGAIFVNQKGAKRSPLVWFDVRPNPIQDRDTFVYQKIAETIGLAYRFDKFSQKQGTRTMGQEVFGISLDNRWIRFWHALVPTTYLDRLQTHDTIPIDDYVVLKQSRPLDLVEPDDRKEFAKMFWSLMHYLRDGDPKIGKMP